MLVYMIHHIYLVRIYGLKSFFHKICLNQCWVGAQFEGLKSRFQFQLINIELELGSIFGTKFGIGIKILFF